MAVRTGPRALYAELVESKRQNRAEVGLLVRLLEIEHGWRDSGRHVSSWLDALPMTERVESVRTAKGFGEPTPRVVRLLTILAETQTKEE